MRCLHGENVAWRQGANKTKEGPAGQLSGASFLTGDALALKLPPLWSKVEEAVTLVAPPRLPASCTEAHDEAVGGYYCNCAMESDSLRIGRRIYGHAIYLLETFVD